MSTHAYHPASMEETTLVRLVDSVAAAHPEQLEVIRAFQPLLIVRNRLLQEGEGETPAPADGQTLPVDSRHLPVDPDTAHETLLRILDAVSEGFPAMWEGAARLRERLSPPLSGRLCRAWLHGDAGLLAELGDKLDVAPELLSFALGQTCRVFMARAAASVPEAPEDVSRRTCPYCGAAPELSVVHGTGGSRSLLCGQCGRGWRYRRTACPACGEDAANNLQSLYVEGRQDERGVWCEQCDRYVLELDVRHRELGPEQCQALTLGLGHLDILLQQEGKTPLAMEIEHA